MRLITLALAALVLACLSAPAQAQTGTGTNTVVLLGLRSVEGDDDVANNLTQALRSQLARMSGMQLIDREVSLSQMSMAYGCEEPDAACLTDIAAGLQTQHVIYGTVRRTSTRSDYQYGLTVSFFSSESGAIENTVTHNVPQDDSNLDHQAEVVLASLMGLEADTGSIMVRTNVAAAEIAVNGQSVGSSVDGSLRLSGLAPGRYQVDVTAEGMGLHRETVRVTAGETTAVTASLQPPVSEPVATREEVSIGTDSRADDRDGISAGTIVGYSLLGVAALGVVGTIYSWTQISSIDGDPDFEAYRRRVGAQAPAVDDVCSVRDEHTAPGDSVRDLCDDADLFETLQWVFLGTAVVAGGAGTYLLLTSGSDADGDANARGQGRALSLRPRISRTTQLLEATVRF